MSDSQEKMTELYASPLRAGVAALFLIFVGVGLVLLPFYQALTGGIDPSGQSLVAVLAFLIIGSLIAFPGVQFARSILMRTPIVTTDGVTVTRIRMGLGTTQIDWSDVGDLGLRGVWIILVDGRTGQSKFGQSMFGAKGVWLPALFVDGGGAATVLFVSDYRPDLIDPVVQQVTKGKTTA